MEGASGVSLAQQAAANLRHPLSIALLALTFSIGTVDAVSYLGLGHVFTANMTGYALALEAALLACAAILVAAARPHPGSIAAYWTIVLMAAAMGIRNATVRRLAVPDLTTTVLTMTITGLAADSTIAGGSGKGTPRRISAVLAMLAGAIAGALMLRTGLTLPLAFAAALALATCLAYRSVSVG
jgi:uncharacterized membrane protein YoaK (UPF0700 family)